MLLSQIKKFTNSFKSNSQRELLLIELLRLKGVISMRFLLYCLTYLWLSFFESLILLPICIYFDSTIITFFLSVSCLFIDFKILGYYYEDI